MRTKLSSLTVVLFAAWLSLPNAVADDGWDRAIVSLTEENDSGLSDRHYTQGAGFSFLSPDFESSRFSDRFLSIAYDVARWKWGLEGGHQMYTPEDIATNTLVRNDRPYAGWAYGGLIFQQRGTNSSGAGVMETLRLQLGIVGPESRADDIQIWWHHVFGFQRPNGWWHQLKDELGFQLGYDRRHLYRVGEKWSAHFIPEAGVALGNVRTDFHIGGTIRGGYNIPNEFGLGGSERGTDFGVYLFGSVRGQAVLLDIFLDGNNFRDSHDVDRRPFVGEGRIGLVFATRHMELSLAHVERTTEYDAQKKTDGFNSLTLTVKF